MLYRISITHTGRGAADVWPLFSYRKPRRFFSLLLKLEEFVFDEIEPKYESIKLLYLLTDLVS